MRALLLHEQRKLCCYCTGSIANLAFHIEHFCPRDRDAALSYTWRNLLASCQGGARHDLVKTRRHCGVAKENWFEDPMVVDPRRTRVDQLFRYPLSGKVVPSKRLNEGIYASVADAIKHLNLNAPSLVERRSVLLTEAAKDAVSMDRAAWCKRYIAEHNDQLQEFWPALQYNYALHWQPAFPQAVGAA